MTANNTLTTLLGVGAIGAAATAAYLWLFRPWHLRWGATTAETKRALPGDELVSNPKQISTRAITIEASIDEVWSWLVQIGQGRGGFYSYDTLENLIGCDIHNADRILPEFQQLAVGDKVRLGKEGYPFYTVTGVEPKKYLLLRGGDPEEEAPSIKDFWLFYLDEIDAQTTRLIARNRRDYTPSVANFIIWQVITEPLHFLMEQKMLRGIKQRAEAAPEQAHTLAGEQPG
jgi:hypothetical protein